MQEKLLKEIDQRGNGSRFDFTDDCAYGDYYRDEKSVWKRYFLYKNDHGAEDPDSKSLFLQKLYRELWPGHFSSEVMPYQIDELEFYFTNVTQWISERSDRMLKRIQEVYEEPAEQTVALT